MTVTGWITVRKGMESIVMRMASAISASGKTTFNMAAGLKSVPAAAPTQATIMKGLSKAKDG